MEGPVEGSSTKGQVRYEDLDQAVTEGMEKRRSTAEAF